MHYMHLIEKVPHKSTTNIPDTDTLKINRNYMAKIAILGGFEFFSSTKRAELSLVIDFKFQPIYSAQINELQFQNY